MAALFFPLLSVLSQAVFGAHIKKVLIPSIVFLTRTMLRRICQASNRLLDTSSDLLLWDGDSEFPLPPVLSPGATRDVYRTNDATRGWKKRARRKEKKRKTLPHKHGDKCTKTVMKIIFRHQCHRGLEVCPNGRFYTVFPPFLCFRCDIIFVSGTHTHTKTHAQWGKEIVWKKLQIKHMYLPDLHLLLLFMSFHDSSIAYAIKF